MFHLVQNNQRPLKIICFSWFMKLKLLDDICALFLKSFMTLIEFLKGQIFAYKHYNNFITFYNFFILWNKKTRAHARNSHFEENVMLCYSIVYNIGIKAQQSGIQVWIL